MAGLSVVLEGHQGNCSGANSCNNVLSKATILKKNMVMDNMIMKPDNNPSPTYFNTLPCSGYRSFRDSVAATADFLDVCFLCKRKLLPGKDIYMYKGDGAFCSIECRRMQIKMDEEESRLSSRMRERKWTPH